MSLNRDAVDTFEDIIVVVGTPDPPRYDFSPDFLSPFPQGDPGGVTVPAPPSAPDPEVVVTARPPGPQPDDWFTWRGQSGPRDVWSQLFAEREDISREVIEDLKREEELQWQRALAKAKGDEVKARQFFRAALLKAGYLASEINDVINRVSGAMLRAAATVAPTITEIVVQASRVPAVRVATGTPLGLAAGIVEGVLTLGGVLSQDALRRRLPPPPLAPAPTPTPRPPESRRPPPRTIPLPQFPATPMDTVTISTPRPTPRAPLQTFSFEQPFQFTGSPFPGPGATAFAGPSLLPVPGNLTGFQGGALPSSGPDRRPRPVSLPAPTPMPMQFAGNCPPQQKRKSKKKKPRDVCYRGEYIERRNGLTKFRERKIPCK